MNWAEIENATSFWEGFLIDVVPQLKRKVKPLFFCDLSDFSRKPECEVKKLVFLIGVLNRTFTVVLSLNQNETELLTDLYIADKQINNEAQITQLRAILSIDILVIHRSKDAIAINGKNVYSHKTYFVDKPLILTGGGDNFNAGFCYGLLMKLSLKQALILANSVSGYYVRTGISPNREELCDFIAKF